MPRAAIAIAIATAALLSGCAGFTVPGLSAGAASANSAMTTFLSDPACAHHDEAELVTGAAGMPGSFRAKVVRDCVAHPSIGVVTQGAVVAPVTQAAP